MNELLFDVLHRFNKSAAGSPYCQLAAHAVCHAARNITQRRVDQHKDFAYLTLESCVCLHADCQYVGQLVWSRVCLVVYVCVLSLLVFVVLCIACVLLDCVRRVMLQTGESEGDVNHYIAEERNQIDAVCRVVDLALCRVGCVVCCQAFGSSVRYPAFMFLLCLCVVVLL